MEMKKQALCVWYNMLSGWA